MCLIGPPCYWCLRRCFYVMDVNGRLHLVASVIAIVLSGFSSALLLSGLRSKMEEVSYAAVRDPCRMHAWRPHHWTARSLSSLHNATAVGATRAWRMRRSEPRGGLRTGYRRPAVAAVGSLVLAGTTHPFVRYALVLY